MRDVVRGEQVMFGSSVIYIVCVIIGIPAMIAWTICRLQKDGGLHATEAVKQWAFTHRRYEAGTTAVLSGGVRHRVALVWVCDATRQMQQTRASWCSTPGSQPPMPRHRISKALIGLAGAD
eukprot:162701-Rhodomonas_salina.1